MSERRPRAPSPHLQTRPVTMLTAIGLCFLLMIMHLVPEIRDASVRVAVTAQSGSR
jgi:hypothetical protein